MTPIVIRVRELRIAKGWSQAQLAEAAATGQGTISLLESGATRRLDLDLLERIAAALSVKTTELLAESPAPRRRRHAAD